jgi:hypothetical protein
MTAIMKTAALALAALVGITAARAETRMAGYTGPPVNKGGVR